MREQDEEAGRQPGTGAEAGRASPEAIAQVARILRRRRSALREQEGAALAAPPAPPRPDATSRRPRRP